MRGSVGRLAKNAHELMSQTIRLKRLPVLSRDDVGLFIASRTQPQKFLGLTQAMTPELFDDDGWERNRSRPPAFRLLQSNPFPCLFHAFGD